MIPIKIRRQIDRVENCGNKLKLDLKDEISKQKYTDIDLQLHSFCRELSDVSDQIANDVWKHFFLTPGARKPNIYWPVSRTETDFLKLISKQGMSSLQQLSSEIYEAFRSTQTWSNSATLVPRIKDVANRRHEENLDMAVGLNRSMSVGHGQMVHIKTLRTGLNGEIEELRGTETTNGLTRPITTELLVEATAVDTKSKSELFGLISSACVELMSLSAIIYRQVKI